MSKERYWDKVNRWICWACSRPASPGLRVCEYHAELFRQKQKRIVKERYWKRVGLRICVACSNPAVLVPVSANITRINSDDKGRIGGRNIYEGKCVDCGKKMIRLILQPMFRMPDKTLPEPTQKEAENIKEGRCISCGARLAPELDVGRVTCKNCRVKTSKIRLTEFAVLLPFEPQTIPRSLKTSQPTSYLLE